MSAVAARFLPVLAAACLAVTMALAGNVDRVQPGDSFAGGVTYADLIRMVVPDFDAAKGTGNQVLDLRHIDSGDMEKASLSSFKLSSVPVVRFDDGDEPRLLLLLDFGTAIDSPEGLAIAALFDGNAPYALMDMANVALDRWTGFAESGHLVSPTGQDVFVVYSEHFNSNQTYGFHTLMTADGGKLAAIDAISTFDERLCAGETKQVARFAFGDGPAGAEPILATVEIESIPSGADCGDAPAFEAAKRTVSVTYRPDEGTGAYTADSDAFERLGEENRQRY